MKNEIILDLYSIYDKRANVYGQLFCYQHDNGKQIKVDLCNTYCYELQCANPDKIFAEHDLYFMGTFNQSTGVLITDNKFMFSLTSIPKLEIFEKTAKEYGMYLFYQNTTKLEPFCPTYDCAKKLISHEPNQKVLRFWVNEQLLGEVDRIKTETYESKEITDNLSKGAKI